MSEQHAAAGFGALFGAFCMLVVDWGRRLLTRRDRTLDDALRLVQELRADHDRLRADLEDGRRERQELESRVARRDQAIAEMQAAMTNMQHQIALLRTENARLLGMACVQAVCDRRVQVEEKNNE